LKSGRDARFRQLPVSYATAEDDDRPIVAAVFDQNSGLKIGDRIVAVNGYRNIRNTSVLAARLRGIEGAVNVTIEREQKEMNVNVIATAMQEVTTLPSRQVGEGLNLLLMYTKISISGSYTNSSCC
jgi:membrane-associated protease RseP (regulator of RpoE activity)